MANRIKFTPKKQADFLDRIAGGWSITDGAKAAGVSTRTIYDHKAADSAFATALEDALEAGSDVLEDEARRRAVDGVTQEKGIYHRGNLVGSVIETTYSDTLLIFLLKGRRPEKFRDRTDQRHSGPDGAPLTFTLALDRPSGIGADDGDR